MTLPLLVPRPPRLVASVTPAPRPVPTYDEWAGVQREIERLYIRERRKLRYIMQYMEREHGFRATEQMYKKRFAKWGFQKNSRRSATLMPLSASGKVSKKLVSGEAFRLRDFVSVPTSPGFNNRDSLMLKFLSSVQICSTTFFESLQSQRGSLAPFQKHALAGHPEESDDISFTFKLVIDLLDRGLGKIAGRMARKAFLLVEDLLTLEGPVLVWNLLELMYHMVTMRHAQLFHMLLAHLIALVDRRMPKSHPISAILHSLRGVVTSLTSMLCNPGSTLPSSSSSTSSSPSSLPICPSPPSTDADTKKPTPNIHLLCHTLLSLLERAWVMNVEIVFNNFDPRLFPLYCHIHWMSCSISPPVNVFNTANSWFDRSEAQQSPPHSIRPRSSEDPFDPIEENKFIQRILAPQMDASPPQNCEMLHERSIAALREHWDLSLSQGSSYSGNTAILLRILVGLVTTNILDEWPEAIGGSSSHDSTTPKVPRFFARKVACAIRILMDIKTDHSYPGPSNPSESIEPIQSILALREYGHSETDPQLLREMLRLEDTLVAAGKFREAQQVRGDAFSRLEKYIQDIPVDSV